MPSFGRLTDDLFCGTLTVGDTMVLDSNLNLIVGNINAQFIHGVLFTNKLVELNSMEGIKVCGNLLIQDGSFIKGNIDINTIVIQNIDMLGNINIMGYALVDNLTSITSPNTAGPHIHGNTIISGSLYVSDNLCADTILTDTIVGKTANSVSIHGNLLAHIIKTQDLFISGNFTYMALFGNLMGLTVTQNATIQNDLIVQGNIEAQTNLNVQGITTTVDVIVQSDIIVQGNAIIQDLVVQNDLYVLNESFFNGNVTIDANAFVTGKLTVNELCVTANAIFNGDTYMLGNLIADDLILNGNLSVTGNVAELSVYDLYVHNIHGFSPINFNSPMVTPHSITLQGVTNFLRTLFGAKLQMMDGGDCEVHGGNIMVTPLGAPNGGGKVMVMDGGEMQVHGGNVMLSALGGPVGGGKFMIVDGGEVQVHGGNIMMSAMGGPVGSGKFMVMDGAEMQVTLGSQIMVDAGNIKVMNGGDYLYVDPITGVQSPLRPSAAGKIDGTFGTGGSTLVSPLDFPSILTATSMRFDSVAALPDGSNIVMGRYIDPTMTVSYGLTSGTVSSGSNILTFVGILPFPANPFDVIGYELYGGFGNQPLGYYITSWNGTNYFINAAPLFTLTVTGLQISDPGEFFFVSKFTPSGAVDTSFGTGGIFSRNIRITLGVPLYYAINTVKVVVDPASQNIFGFVTTFGSGSIYDTQDLAFVFKLTPAGALDTTWAGNVSSTPVAPPGYWVFIGMGIIGFVGIFPVIINDVAIIGSYLYFSGKYVPAVSSGANWFMRRLFLTGAGTGVYDTTYIGPQYISGQGLINVSPNGSKFIGHIQYHPPSNGIMLCAITQQTDNIVLLWAPQAGNIYPVSVTAQIMVGGFYSTINDFKVIQNGPNIGKYYFELTDRFDMSNRHVQTRIYQYTSVIWPNLGLPTADATFGTAGISRILDVAASPSSSLTIAVSVGSTMTDQSYIYSLISNGTYMGIVRINSAGGRDTSFGQGAFGEGTGVSAFSIFPFAGTMFASAAVTFITMTGIVANNGDIVLIGYLGATTEPPYNAFIARVKSVSIPG